MYANTDEDEVTDETIRTIFPNNYKEQNCHYPNRINAEKIAQALTKYTHPGKKLRVAW